MELGGRELHFKMHNNIIIIATIYLLFLHRRHCARFITFNPQNSSARPVIIILI